MFGEWGTEDNVGPDQWPRFEDGKIVTVGSKVDEDGVIFKVARISFIQDGFYFNTSDSRQKRYSYGEKVKRPTPHDSEGYELLLGDKGRGEDGVEWEVIGFWPDPIHDVLGRNAEGRETVLHGKWLKRKVPKGRKKVEEKKDPTYSSRRIMSRMENILGSGDPEKLVQNARMANDAGFELMGLKINGRTIPPGGFRWPMTDGFVPVEVGMRLGKGAGKKLHHLMLTPNGGYKLFDRADREIWAGEPGEPVPAPKG